MNNQKRDVKFIIYQALYIFVICVVTIKGANLDLTEVDEKKMIEPGWTYVDTTNKVIIDRNDLSKMIVFDSTKYMIVSIDDYRNNPGKYVSIPPIQVGDAPGSQNPINTNTTNNPENPQVTHPNTDPKIPPMVPPGSMQLVQYHDNSVPNKNSYPISIKGIIIPANSTKTVRIENENNVLISSEGGSMTVATIQNKRPEIKIQPITPMGEDAKVSQLQRTVCFRVTIQDDFPDQLDVKFSGPVTFKQKDNTTYDITMNAFSSNEAFKNFTDSHESPYRLGFNVIVKDKIAPHSVTGQQNFVFGEW